MIGAIYAHPITHALILLALCWVAVRCWVEQIREERAE